MLQRVFRFAPSPNGELHLGHAYSALLNERMARAAGGRLLLRIEDTDRSRCGPAFVRQMVDDLAWLGIAFETPVRTQSEHMGEYLSTLRDLWAIGVAYPCFCSRQQVRSTASSSLDPDGQPHYAGTCRTMSREHAVRRLETGAPYAFRLDMARCGDGAAAVWGDVAIARPVNGSSYTIAVVVDDAAQGVTDVVRGQDLEAATPVHQLLQRLLGLPQPRYVHHPLIRDGGGQKLSKSAGSPSLASLRQAGKTPLDVRRQLGFDTA